MIINFNDWIRRCGNNSSCFSYLTKIIVIVFCFAGSGSLWAADEWPMFKSDAAHDALNPADTLPQTLINKFGTGSSLNANTVAYSSPVMLNDRVYIGFAGGQLWAINGSSTTPPYLPLWTYQTSGGIYGSPAVATIGGADYAFVGSTDGNLYGFNGTNGTLVMTEAMGGPIFTSPLAQTKIRGRKKDNFKTG